MEVQQQLPGIEPEPPKAEKPERLKPNFGPPCPDHKAPMHVYCIVKSKKRSFRYFKCPVEGCQRKTKARVSKTSYHDASSIPVVDT